MSYVVESGSKQYLVEPGQEIIVDRLTASEGDVVELNLVHAYGKQSKAKKVSATVKKHLKGKKLRVVKYKSKSNYHKVTGFRPYQTLIEIK